MTAVLAIVTEKCRFAAEGAVGLKRQAAVAATDLTCFDWIPAFWASCGSYWVNFAAERANIVVRRY
jgi:hypothetical protein